MKARRKGELLIAGLCLLATMLACTGSALAARPHEFKEAFGVPCIAEPCEGESLKEPDGVAVNEATGDVYVVDEGANRVVRFSEGGSFLSEFNGSGLLPGEEHAAGSGGKAGEVETGRFEKPETIAVDNSCVLRKLSESELTQKECEEADPSNGDVYVVDAGKSHLVIDKYSPAGEYLGQITEGAGGVRFFWPLDGVAVDAHGEVLLFQENFVISRYTSATPNAFSSVTELNGFLDFGLPGFAIDSHANFYVRHGDEVTSKVAKVSSTGTILNRELDNEFSSAVAVDQRSDDPAICNLGTVAVFDPEGTLLERLGQEGGAEHLGRCAGIGVNAGAGSLYAADGERGVVALFSPAEPSAPKVESESVSDVTSNSASLGAQINPRSEVGEGPTEYHFQYGLCASASSCGSSGYEASAPLPDGQIEADFEVHGVSVVVNGLKPSSTYHFRVLAKNSHGQGQPGEERTFTTEAGGGELVLPDNRGWELVSPPDKQGGRIEPITESGVVQAAGSGAGITYLANAPTEAQPQGYTNEVQVLSRRASAAWSSRDIAIPHDAATGSAIGPGPEYKLFSPELTQSAVQPFGQFIPELSEEASESTAYLHDLGAGCGAHCFKPLVTGKAGFANVAEGTVFGEEERCIPKGETTSVVCGPQFLGATADLSHVVLTSIAALQSGAEPVALYEWSGGTLSAVSVLPGAKDAVEGSLGLSNQAARGAISSDGQRIVWEKEPNLYLRDMSRSETIQLDKAACGGCESGGGRFQLASADGTRVLFSDERRLSEDSGASPGEHEADLYECRVAPGTEPGCELHDLTPKHGGEGADVQGGVLGASEDGEQVYFVARGVLSEAANARGQSAVAGQANLYVHSGSGTSFIATLSGGDSHDWEEALARQPTRVSPDGRYLELMSQAPLTGYDNRDGESGQPVAEVYVYDALSGRLSCTSCIPSGARPRGVEYEELKPGSGGLVGGPREIWPEHALVGANVPGWTAIGTGGELKSRHQPRYLSDEGRLFFNTIAALVPQDANGTQDVYQYEPPEVGDCSEASASFSARSGGCVTLISSGRSAQESAFMDASESGDDAFFLTSAKLSALDTDTARDVYDAHVCTSSSPCITFPEVQSPPCTTEASCKAAPTPQPAIFGAPASATFSGPGNLPPAPPKVRTAAEIKAEHLAKALKACRAKKNKHKRKVCEAQARKRYGPPKAKKSAKAKAKARAKTQKGKK